MIVKSENMRWDHNNQHTHEVRPQQTTHDVEPKQPRLEVGPRQPMCDVGPQQRRAEEDTNVTRKGCDKHQDVELQQTHGWGQGHKDLRVIGLDLKVPGTGDTLNAVTAHARITCSVMNVAVKRMSDCGGEANAGNHCKGSDVGDMLISTRTDGDGDYRHQIHKVKAQR